MMPLPTSENPQKVYRITQILYYHSPKGNQGPSVPMYSATYPLMCFFTQTYVPLFAPLELLCTSLCTSTCTLLQAHMGPSVPTFMCPLANAPHQRQLGFARIIA